MRGLNLALLLVMCPPLPSVVRGRPMAEPRPTHIRRGAPLPWRGGVRRDYRSGWGPGHARRERRDGQTDAQRDAVKADAEAKRNRRRCHALGWRVTLAPQCLGTVVEVMCRRQGEERRLTASLLSLLSRSSTGRAKGLLLENWGKAHALPEPVRAYAALLVVRHFWRRDIS